MIRFFKNKVWIWSLIPWFNSPFIQFEENIFLIWSSRFRKPLKVNGYKDDNKIAIIIGIEKYVYLANLDAPFANRDASAFREYTNRALGVKSSNIKLLVDHKASRPQILETFKLWLPRIAGEGGKDIYIFFAGHGLSSDDGKDLYILPQDGNSKLLEDTAITRVELIKLIQLIKLIKDFAGNRRFPKKQPPSICYD